MSNENSTRSSSSSASSVSSSKKRNSNATHSLQLSKKRVPLGEITNSLTTTTVGSTQISVSDSTHKHLHHLKKVNQQQDSESLSTTAESTQNSSDIEISNHQSTKCKGKIRNQWDLDSSLSSGSNQDLVLKKCSFSSSMYGYLHSLEIEDERRCSSNYMTEVQTDVSVKMREILVDWLAEVAEEYKLVSDTLYLTVSYIDRFLSLHALGRNKLQLLGVSCMLIASKYEEISPPHVEDFCYITDNTYSKEEVVNMEKEVLECLSYEMSTPTAKNFLRILTKVAQEYCESPDLQFEFLSCYLAELSLLDYQCLRFLPSAIAASAVFLSRFTIQPKMHPWNASLQRCSGYRPSDLKECVLAIHDLQLNKKASAVQAIRDKYAQHKFKRVARLSSSSEIPVHYFEAAEE